MKQILAFVLLLITGSPFAFALSDSELIQSVANVCVSGNHEEDDCKIMREAAQRFDVPELDTLVTMLCNRILDIGDKQTKVVTNKLLARAENVFGKESIEAFKCRRAVISAYGTTEKKISLDLAAENVEYASRLLARSPKSYQMQELSLLAQLDLLMIQQNDESENPQRWEQVYKIEKQVDELYGLMQEDSYERMEIYLLLGNLKPPFYGNFVGYLSNKLFYDTYPQGSPVESCGYSNGIITNAVEYYRLAYEMGCRLYGENDLRTLVPLYDAIQLHVYCNTYDREECYWHLKEIYDILEMQCAHEDLFVINVKSLMWDCNILTGNRIDETLDYLTVLDCVKNSYGSESEVYFNCLYWMLSQRERVSLFQAKTLAEEVMKLVDKVYINNVDKVLECLIGLFEYMQSQAASDVTQFSQYIERLLKLYLENHKLTWLSIANGCNLSFKLFNCNRLADGCKILELAIEDIKQLVGEDSYIYISKLYELATVLSSAMDYKKAEEVCFEVIRLDHQEGYKPAIYDQLSIIYKDNNDIDKSISVLRKGVVECQNDATIWNPYLRLSLGYNLIQKQIKENGYNFKFDEIDNIIPSAIIGFLDKEDEVSGTFFNGYLLISDYYQFKEDYGKALEILLRGFERFQATSGFYDQTFVHFAGQIYRLYANQFNDFEKAERFISGHIEEIRRNQSYSEHGVLVDLLLLRYDAIRNKGLSWEFSVPLLQEVQNELLKMFKISGGGQDKIFMYIPYLVTLFSGLVDILGNTVNTTSRDVIDQVLKTEQIRDMYSQFIPQLLDLEEMIRTHIDDYLLNWDYINVVGNISDTYLYLEKDYEKAIAWQRKLLDSPVAKYLAVKKIAGYYLSQGNYKEAVQFYEQVLMLSNETKGAMTSSMHKENFYNSYFWACYKSGMYDKALVAAKEYQKYRSNILQNNFEMMTQTEREGFLNNGGAGSGGLELLLPNFPNELSGDVYNSMLQEKGLLLRASDRFRRSVMNSGNTDLINSLNTLDGLKAEFAKMEQMPNKQQGDFNISPEYLSMQNKIEALEKTIKRDGEEYFTQTDTVPEWQDIQQHLNYDEVAIEFVLSDSLAGALVLKPDMKAPLYVPLTNSYELNAEMSDLSKLPIEEHTARLYQSDELGLYAKLWKPLESVLSGVRRVYFSPTGYLNTLAFAAIRCPGGEYLADRYDMHQLTTTAEIVKRHNRNSTNENKTALLVGDVYYSPEHEDMANEFRLLNAYSDKRAAVEDEFGYLPFTGKEIADISAVMQKSGYSCRTCSGNDATEANLNLIDGDSPEILHLSTHGFFVASDEDVTTNKFLEKYPGMRFSSMYRSGLAFVGANEAWEGLSASVEDNNDGIVTSNEVSVLDLRNTRLAVLSACQTAVGYYSKEGVFGMNRGFKQAGVQSIIATLWNVNDESTSMFMSKFYSKWLSGIPMQQSFKEAMVELRELYPSPYYWAPFILVDAK